MSNLQSYILSFFKIGSRVQHFVRDKIDENMQLSMWSHIYIKSFGKVAKKKNPCIVTERGQKLKCYKIIITPKIASTATKLSN